MVKLSCLVSVVIPVFRDGERALAATQAILRQSLPDGWQCEVIVVDDGSDDDTNAQLSKCNDTRVHILRLPSNQGRSAARNAGAAIASSELVVFMDCDCVPDAGFLSAHLAALSAGAAASTGHVTGNGNGFWSRYQSEASKRRQRQHRSGITWAGSSQNLAVRRSTFEAVGGFDSGYRQYGFEDRDLLLRIAAIGHVAWADTAIVAHHDRLALSQVSSKMMEAGKYSSVRFGRQHPDAYLELGYAAIDARGHLLKTLMSPACIVAAKALSVSFDCLRAEYWLPYPIAKLVVKATTAMSYLGGTSQK